MANDSTKQIQHENVIILGAGPAGLVAALYAARAELNPFVLTGMELGGQASLTNVIENYPGFPDGDGGARQGATGNILGAARRGFHYCWRHPR
ncbi:hypothetical protein SDC9_199564 [bioreactor metagenome]|uniref:FAD/NAD(P)-binding domain-containing protein n=1 Tax=bioreactor metagenome TaxID=1076179 RepID=A0A645IXI6_9ZZZZ